MKGFLKVILLICPLMLIHSCKTPHALELEDEEVWRLGWRMIENSMEEKYRIGELQFDSLIKTSDLIDHKFLKAGLEIKWKLDKTQEVTELLGGQDEEMLRGICREKFLSGLTPCIGFLEDIPGNKPLQLELVKMYINDQYVRLNLLSSLLEKYNLIKSEVITDTFGINTDEWNQARLKDIINKFSFPTIDLVGKDGMEAVFNIIQHADIEWQKSQLVKIEEAVKNDDMEAENYAFLYDRIKVLNGERQLYGTQVLKVNPISKSVQLFETEDLENIDKRRRELGMMPIEMYKRIALKNS